MVNHDVGDALLLEVAQRITANIREEDTVSRQGGDEFTLLLNEIESYDQCRQTLERIHHSLAQPFLIDNYSHKITASSGISIFPQDNSDIDTLLRHADQAMYQAKLAGKNNYHLFNPEHDQRTIQKHHQLVEIEHALTNNEFQLYYQPKVNMVSGEVYGAEALIRWIHPENSLIPPLDFLPSIEGTELEIKLGDWVINEALHQLEVWRKQDIKLEVSVNISSHHILSDSFLSLLEQALSKHSSVNSKCLQLEILESSVLSDLNAISSIITTCQKTLGVNIALDDFGTGYSSLTHLRNLPANTIKIDQSFIRDMLDDPSDSAIIDGVIGLADSFNREVIAEGVETTEHGLMLILMGCDHAQGYGIAKPMPATEFPKWLSQYIPNQEWLLTGNTNLSLKETKAKTFLLASQQWKNKFTEIIHNEPQSSELWPIMNHKKCPCGTWIIRAKQEHFFDHVGLKKLEQTHNDVHSIAATLQSQYQANNIDAAREGVTQLQLAFADMEHALDICE
ncbi:MAG: EAL domain-containing protein [Gammaproteobacteria bacterium]|nr:EAL domain-containing protein [Gammaproteobacteria bacterium]